MASSTLTDDPGGRSPAEGPEPGLTLAWSRGLARAGEQVSLAGRSALLLGREAKVFPGGPLSDGRISARHAAMACDRGRWLIADRGSKNGTFVNGARITRHELHAGDVIRVGGTYVVFGEVPARAPSAPPGGLASLVGVSASMARAREGLGLVAASAHTVLLLGESGTGKEVAARALHEASGREGPFLAVNCASLRGELLESELFGHVRGAFTGAQRPHEGLFRRADRGTVLLDEVAELEEPVQARLLRVLEARAVRPVGASEEIPVSTRVVAATNQDVALAVREGRFRSDLYARLARWTVTLPPLRERREDIGPLTQALLAREGPAPEVDEALMKALLLHRWPLNVRGLVNVLTTARIGQPGASTLGLDARTEAALAAQDELVEAAPGAPGAPSAEPDAAQVAAILRAHKGNVAALCRELQLSRPRAYRLFERLAIDPDDYRG